MPTGGGTREPTELEVIGKFEISVFVGKIVRVRPSREICLFIWA